MRASARRSPSSRRSTMFCKVYLHLRSQAISLNVATYELNDFVCGCARPETALDAHRLDGGYILVRQNTTSSYQHIIHSVLLQQFHYAGKDGHVCSRENTHQDSIHVLLDSRFNNHFRC